MASISGDIFAQALALHQGGRLDEAASLYAEVLGSDPRHVDALHMLGVLEGQRGRIAEAEALFAKVLTIQPRSTLAAANRSIMLRALGRLEEALASAELALAVDGADVPMLASHAQLLFDLGRMAAAATAAAKVLTLAPDDARAHLLGARVAGARAQPERAERGYARTLAVRADLAEVWSALGLVRLDLAGPASALRAYGRAIALNPADATALMNRANALRRLGHAEAALPWFSRVIALRADYAEAYYNRGLALKDLHRVERAIGSYRQALALKPEFAEAHHNLGIPMLGVGARDEGIAAFGRAAAAAPGLPNVERARLGATLYARPVDRNFFNRAVALATREAPKEKLPSCTNDRNPDRKLKVGFLSSDFHSHPIARNMRAIFEYRDRRVADYVCYAHERRSDALSEWYRAQVDAWRPVQALTDREVAALIRRDGIDVLVFLAGYFDHNRPAVAAWRAAPVQVSLGDAATSGIQEMDYFITDPVLSPEDTSEPFVEALARLPILYNHVPRSALPVLARPPAEDGAVVFASFNNPVKLSPMILLAWRRILQRLPRARLVLKYKDDFARPWLQRRILGSIGPEPEIADRVSFIAADEVEDRHLMRHADVDIALDSYPFSGATTSFDAMWMGVPVVTLLGETYVSRMTASHLIPIGLPELVARSVDDYVEIAVALAGDPSRLRHYRAILRDRLLASPLMDGPEFARSFEVLLRALWRRWSGSS